MDIEFLKNVLVAAETRSISKASEKLNITHPALSKQIRKVEEYFGVSLFTRSSAGVELTTEGVLFCQRAASIVTEFELLHKEAIALSQKKAFSLGTLPSIAVKLLPPRVVELKKNGVEVKTEVKNTSIEVLSLLKEGKIDAGIVDDLGNNTLLWRKRLFEEPLYLVVPKTHRLAMRETVSMEDLVEEEFVFYPPACSIRNRVVRIMQEIGAELKISAEVAFGEFIIGFVSAGAGVTIVPEISVGQVGHSELVGIPITHEHAKRKVYLVSNNNSAGKYIYRLLKMQ